MTYTIKAIPTMYNHTMFRSRLEARWAAFFDLAGWGWDYEPFDLDGWAPDFLLKGAMKALVEVKPIDFVSDEQACYSMAKAQAAKAFDTAAKVREARDRDVDCGPQYELLVLGNGPFRNTFTHAGSWSLGVMALEEFIGPDIADLYFGRSSSFDYAARYGNYKYRIGGEYDGDGHLDYIGGDEPEHVWRQAGNIVQWSPPCDMRAITVPPLPSSKASA